MVRWRGPGWIGQKSRLWGRLPGPDCVAMRPHSVASVIGLVSNARIIKDVARENSRRFRRGTTKGKVQDNIDIWLMSSGQTAGRIVRPAMSPELAGEIAKNLYLGRGFRPKSRKRNDSRHFRL
jgi:hypothetical protein